MGIDLRMPNINGATEREQLAQIRSYLYQFIPQLQWAISNLETSSPMSQMAQQVIRERSSGNASASAEANFNAIKALIIKSADIVDAYYEEINSRLSGLYVAESDFGVYAEETDQRINANSMGVTQAFSNTQVVADNLSAVSNSVTDISGTLDDVKEKADDAENRIDTLDQYVIDTKAVIRAGILYYVDKNGDVTNDQVEGTAVYGVEIGQQDEVNGEKVFNKFARFTAKMLAFYDYSDPINPLAYISNLKLYIRNVEVTSSYKIGGYVDTVESDGRVVTKWVGGEG